MSVLGGWRGRRGGRHDCPVQQKAAAKRGLSKGAVVTAFCDMCGTEIPPGGQVFGRVVRGEPADVAGAVRDPEFADTCSRECADSFLSGNPPGRLVVEFSRKRSAVADDRKGPSRGR